MRLLDAATRSGITATGDAYVFERDLADWQKFKQEGKLNQHIRLYIQGNVGTGVINTSAIDVLRYYEKYYLPGTPGVMM